MDKLLATLAVQSAMIRVAVLSVSIATTLAFARLLTADGFGVYIYFLAASLLALVPLQSSISIMVMREWPKIHLDSSPHLIRRFFSLLFLAVSLTSLFGGFLFYASLTLVQVAETDSNIFLPAIYTVTVSCYGFTTVITSLMRSAELHIIGQLTEFLLRPLLLLALIFLTFFILRLELDGTFVIILHTTSAGIGLVIAGSLLLTARSRFQSVAVLHRSEAPNTDPTIWRKSLLGLAIAGLSQVVFSKTDVIMLGYFSGNSAVAYYHVSWQVANLTFLANMAVFAVLAPKLGQFSAEGNFKAFAAMARRGASIVLLTTIPAAFLLYAVGYDLMRVLFGMNYAQNSFNVAILIAVGYVFQAYFGFGDTLLKLKNFEHVVAWGILFAAVINIVLNSFAIPAYGNIGAAGASVASTLLLKLFFSVQSSVRVGTSGTAIGL